jgi:hypothetical protein
LRAGEAFFPLLFRGKLREQPLGHGVLLVFGQSGSGIERFLEQVCPQLTSRPGLLIDYMESLAYQQHIHSRFSAYGRQRAREEAPVCVAPVLERSPSPSSYAKLASISW